MRPRDAYNPLWRCLFWQCLPLALLAVAGCERPAPKLVEAKPPEVLVATPTAQVVTEHEEFTGRLVAVSTIEIRARVSGYLERVLFKDGADVKAGDPLVEIDARPFQAQLERDAATVAQMRARLERLQLQEDRARTLFSSKTITKEAFDQAVFDRAEAQASLENAQAAESIARLNLNYTRITAPISGRISRRLVDPGNLVRADETPLVTLGSVDPVYAYFDIDERSVLRLRRLMLAGKMSLKDSQMVVQVALADEENFGLTGRVDFFDTFVDAATGTLRVRCVIDNPGLLLAPGFFVRVRIPIGLPRTALLVREEALGTDQGQRFVYLVNEKNEIVYRRVRVGFLSAGQRVIDEGLEPGDRVVVTGLQRVRPGVKVVPRPAPTDKAAQTAAAPSGG